MELIIGAVVSLIVQFLKRYAKESWQTVGILLVISLAAASLYTALVATGYWSVLATILVTAGAFYAYILRWFEK